MAATTFMEAIELAGCAQPTLKAIAEVLGVPQQRIYSVAKQPKEGEVYNAHVYNWDAINKFIAKRIGKDGDEFGTFEEVLEAANAKDAEYESSDKRRGSRGGSAKPVIDLGDGKSMPARRKEIAVGDMITLRNSDEVLEVKMLTATHVVLGIPGSELLTCLSNWTFNQKVNTVTKAEDAE